METKLTVTLTEREIACLVEAASAEVMRHAKVGAEAPENLVLAVQELNHRLLIAAHDEWSKAGGFNGRTNWLGKVAP